MKITTRHEAPAPQVSLEDEEVYRRHVAGMLVVGFVRCWSVRTLCAAVPVVVKTADDAETLHGRCRFMPKDLWRYLGKSGVREFVAAEYPKLHAFLSANSKKPDRLLGVVPQIIKLRSRGAHIKRLSDEDIKDGNRVRRDAIAVRVSNEAARAQQLSTQRSSWNTCKA